MCAETSTELRGLERGRGMASRSVTVYGKVHSKGRPRFFRGHAVTPKSTRDYEALIRAAWREKYPQVEPFAGPLKVAVEVHRALPKSAPKKTLWAWDTGKPDADNIAKAVLDALNGIAYEDDAQVVVLHVVKWPRERIEERIDIEVEEICAAEDV